MLTTTARKIIFGVMALGLASQALADGDNATGDHQLDFSKAKQAYDAIMAGDPPLTNQFDVLTRNLMNGRPGSGYVGSRPCPDAEYFLGLLKIQGITDYHKPNWLERKTSRTKDRDAEAGIERIKNAAKSGQPQACLYIGNLYISGKLGPVNQVSASKFWAMAINQTTVKTKASISSPNDEIKNNEKLLLAAESGDEEAELKIGKMYLDANDRINAKKFLSLAADQKNREAKKLLSSLASEEQQEKTHSDAAAITLAADKETREEALRQLKSNLKQLEEADKTGEVILLSLTALADSGDKAAALRLGKKYAVEKKLALAKNYAVISGDLELQKEVQRSMDQAAAMDAERIRKNKELEEARKIAKMKAEEDRRIEDVELARKAEEVKIARKNAEIKAEEDRKAEEMKLAREAKEAADRKEAEVAAKYKAEEEKRQIALKKAVAERKAAIKLEAGKIGAAAIAKNPFRIVRGEGFPFGFNDGFKLIALKVRNYGDKKITAISADIIVKSKLGDVLGTSQLRLETVSLDAMDEGVWHFDFGSIDPKNIFSFGDEKPGAEEPFTRAEFELHPKVIFFEDGSKKSY